MFGPQEQAICWPFDLFFNPRPSAPSSFKERKARFEEICRPKYK